MPQEESIVDLLRFLRSHTVCVLASVVNNSTHATTIFYYVEDDLRFYFLTRNQSPKFPYVSKNSSVGIAVTDEKLLQTVQAEGVAKEVDYSKDYSQTMEKFISNLEKSGYKWENFPINHMPNTGYYSFIQISPTWIRWTDFSDWSHAVKFEKKFT